MAFLSILKNSRKEEVSLLIDIGNGSVTLALVLFREKQVPEFLYVDTEYFSTQLSGEPKKLIDELLKNLDFLLAKMVQNGFTNKYLKDNGVRINGGLVTFSSPWFTAKTSHVNLSQDKDFVITKKFLNDILEKEQKDFILELTKNISDSDESIFHVIEKSIVHTRVNGYILSSVIGKKTKYFDTFIHISVVGRNITQKIDYLINKYAHIEEKNIVFHTFPLISFSTIRDIFHGSNDFVIMDVTSDATDITLVQNEVISQTASMPFGKNFILKQISKNLNTDIEIAKSMLKTHIEQKLDKESEEKMEKILVDIEKEWSIYLENALGELCPDMNLPKNVFLTADDDIAQLFVEFLNLSKTDSTASWRKGINVTKIDKNTLASFYSAEDASKVNQFIALVAIFYNKFFQER